LSRPGKRTRPLITTASNVDLTGWGLADTAGGRTNLTGAMAAGAVLQIQVDGSLRLGNQGDSIVLIDAGGASIDQVSYKADEVRTGRTIYFAR
jgi:hypothetical protein